MFYMHPCPLTLVLTTNGVHHCNYCGVVWMTETEDDSHSPFTSLGNCCNEADSTGVTKRSSLGRSSEVLGTPFLVLSFPF